MELLEEEFELLVELLNDEDDDRELELDTELLDELLLEDWELELLTLLEEKLELLEEFLQQTCVAEHTSTEFTGEQLKKSMHCDPLGQERVLLLEDRELELLTLLEEEFELLLDD